MQKKTAILSPLAGPLAVYAMIPFLWGVAAAIRGDFFSSNIEATPVVCLVVGAIGLGTALVLRLFARP